MVGPPGPISIYHITHVDNLASILATSGLLSDVEMIARGGPQVSVGMSTIKLRRLGLPVTCHPGDFVGEYVPFYFCSRSIMLYVLHRANHEELSYRGGQEPIVHLEADVDATVAWTTAAGSRWAFSLANAGARYTVFRDNLARLADVDWSAVAAWDFRAPAVNEGKQAEFLVQRFVPWHLIQRVGVCNARIQAQVLAALVGAAHQPAVDVLPRWYF